MAKDDYFVIVYQILAYLYQRLKKGEPVEEEALKHESKLFRVNEKYWKYIIINMLNQGYINGITVRKVWGDVLIEDLGGAQITPAGIEYLCENSMMKKAIQYAKDIKEILPLP